MDTSVIVINDIKHGTLTKLVSLHFRFVLRHVNFWGYGLDTD